MEEWRYRYTHSGHGGNEKTRLLPGFEPQSPCRLAFFNFAHIPFKSFMLSRLTFNATPTNNTHKESIVNCLLYIVYYILRTWSVQIETELSF
jgi:hypothetical protein